MPVLALLDTAIRAFVVVALALAGAIAFTHWAVRSKRLSPFGAWPRFVRRTSDPLLLPVERRVMRAGGSPQDAPLWLLLGVVIGGLLIISLFHWLIGALYRLAALADVGPCLWLHVLIDWTFSLLMFALLVRVIASWFGISPYGRWMRPVMALTNWLIEPIRRLLPPFGMFDLSPLVAYLVLLVARGMLLGIL
jgi:YggT family protein